MASSADVGLDLWGEITARAAAESPLWADAVLPAESRIAEPVFSPLAPAAHALGLETIYEGYLAHYGRPRLFAPADVEGALLLGDYLYAHGLVQVAAVGEVAAVADLAELISLCAQLRADGREGDGAVWAATASVLGRGGLEEAREALRLGDDEGPLERVARTEAGAAAWERARAAHVRLVG